MQNSGLDNALNPLVSLAHKGVYGIPMLLMIGYRGRNPEEDEPQHGIQGPATIPWLNAAGLAVHEIVQPDEVANRLLGAFAQAWKNSSPVCVLLGPGLLDSSKNMPVVSSQFPTRAEIVEFLVEHYQWLSFTKQPIHLPQFANDLLRGVMPSLYAVLLARTGNREPAKQLDQPAGSGHWEQDRISGKRAPN